MHITQVSSEHPCEGQPPKHIGGEVCQQVVPRVAQLDMSQFVGNDGICDIGIAFEVILSNDDGAEPRERSVDGRMFFQTYALRKPVFVDS